jgi:hypothetical protein
MEFSLITEKNGNLGFKLLIFGLKLCDFVLSRLNFGLEVRKVLKFLLKLIDFVLELYYPKFLLLVIGCD